MAFRDRKTVGPAVYGGDTLGTRYYRTTQLTSDNVASLKQVWSTSAVDGAGPGVAFQSSPVFSEGKLIVITPRGKLMAVDGATGEELWRFRPRGFKVAEPVTKRGASVWPGTLLPKRAARVFYCYKENLVAVDAETGKAIPSFGDNGQIAIWSGGRKRYQGFVTYNSPPLIAGNLVVCGSAIPDNMGVGTPEGAVTAFDCITGERRWEWRPIESNASARADDIVGAANVWAVMSYDPVNNSIYANTGSASNDSFGGTRRGNNEHANSIVCLDATTGKLKWSRQLIHHDLWDYDLPGQPLLLDYKATSGNVRAVAVVTKTGFMFLFNRDTGQPLFSIEERPVPPSKVPGEFASPTQPFPSAPPPLCPQGVTMADAWGATASDEKHARKFIAKYGDAALFTPPSVKGVLQRPGVFGGCNWSGMAFDPKQRLIITTTNNLPVFTRLAPDPKSSFHMPDVGGDGTGPMYGTPYIALCDSRMFKGLPYLKPPWGTMVAVDPAEGRIVWQKPFGQIPAASGVPGYENFGSPSLGGAFTTSSGLTFIAGTMDHHLRAFETATGRELAALPLPYGGQSLPVTYRIRGREFVAVCAGGHFAIDRDFGAQIVAFAL